MPPTLGRLGTIINMNGDGTTVADTLLARAAYEHRWRLMMEGRFRKHGQQAKFAAVPLVIVRHPIVWLFKSMCHSSYNVKPRLKHVQGKNGDAACKTGAADVHVQIGKFNTGISTALYASTVDAARKQQEIRGAGNNNNVSSVSRHQAFVHHLRHPHTHPGDEWWLREGEDDPGCAGCMKIRRTDSIQPWKVHKVEAENREQGMHADYWPVY